MLKEIVLPPIDMKNFSDQPIDSNLIIMSHDFNVNELVIPFYETNVFDTYEAFYSFQGNTSIIIQEVYKQNNEIRIPIVNDVRRHKGIFTIELNASSNSTQATLLKLNVMVRRSNIDSNSEFLFNHYYKLFEDYEKEIAELSNATQATIKTQLKQSQENLQKVTKTLIAINDKVVVVNDTADGFMTDVATKQADVTNKYNAFDTSVTTAGQTIDDILALQPQFQAVLDETTGKDVISAPEIILARNGEADLKTRLDKEHQEVTAQLAETALNVKSFGAKGDGITDDTEAIKQAILFLANHETYDNLIFPNGEYVVSGPIAKHGAEVSLTNKTIDGRHSTIIDKRGVGDHIFVFVNSDTVVFKNFYVVGEYPSHLLDTNFITGSFLSFDKQNNNIKISNIHFKNFRGTGIFIAPRENMPVTNVWIENITGDVVRSALLLLSSFDTSYMPSEIRNITVHNVIARYAGAYRGSNGQITRPLSNHWTPGIDYGEALSLLENAHFSNCHVSHSSETGFHVEGGCACVNVQFHNCSSKFNGQRAGAVYGHGFIIPEGVSVNNCITEGNRSPYAHYSTNSPNYEKGTAYYVDIYDEDYGMILDGGQTVLSFDDTNKISLINQHSDKKTYNYFDEGKRTFSRGHDTFISFKEGEDDYKYYFGAKNMGGGFSDLIIFDPDSIYKITIKYKKIDTIQDRFNFKAKSISNTTPSSAIGQITMNKGEEVLNKILSDSRHIRSNRLPDLKSALEVSSRDEVFLFDIEKMTTKPYRNLIVNGHLLEGAPFDFRYYDGDAPSSSFINLVDDTKAFKLVNDSDGYWMSNNRNLAENRASTDRLWSNEFPIAKFQKVSVSVAYKSDLEINTDLDNISVGMRLMDKDGVLLGVAYERVKDISTVIKSTTFVLDASHLINSDNCYFNLFVELNTDKMYSQLTPIKFKVTDVHLIY